MKSKAVEKARRQAEIMVKPLNQKIGKAIFISDINTQFVSGVSGSAAEFRFKALQMRAQEYGYNSVPIEFEKIKVVSAVIVKFLID